MSDMVTSDFNIGWQRADWNTIAADGSLCELMMVAESGPVNVHGIVILVPIFFAKSESG